MKMVQTVLFGCLLALGCVLITSCAGVNASALAALKAADEAICPEYIEYVDKDTALTAEQKQRRHNTVDDFHRARIAAETGK